MSKLATSFPKALLQKTSSSQLQHLDGQVANASEVLMMPSDTTMIKTALFATSPKMGPQKSICPQDPNWKLQNY